MVTSEQLVRLLLPPGITTVACLIGIDSSRLCAGAWCWFWSFVPGDRAWFLPATYASARRSMFELLRACSQMSCVVQWRHAQLLVCSLAFHAETACARARCHGSLCAEKYRVSCAALFTVSVCGQWRVPSTGSSPRAFTMKRWFARSGGGSLPAASVARNRTRPVARAHAARPTARSCTTTSPSTSSTDPSAVSLVCRCSVRSVARCRRMRCSPRCRRSVRTSCRAATHRSASSTSQDATCRSALRDATARASITSA